MPKIQFKRKKSTGIGTNKLSAGEPLYNLYDKKLYIGGNASSDETPSKHLTEITVGDASSKQSKISVGEAANNDFTLKAGTGMNLTTSGRVITVAADHDIVNNSSGATVAFTIDGKSFSHKVAVTFPSEVELAKKLTSARTITLAGDAEGSVDFDGSQNVTLTAAVKSAELADSADKWTTGRKITLAGDAAGNVNIDGSADVTLYVAVKDDSHNHTISATGIDGLMDVTATGGANSVEVAIAPYTSQQSKASFDSSTIAPKLNTRLNYNGDLYATNMYGNNSSGTPTKVVLTDDSRLSDTRTPKTHSHGNITNGGIVGEAARVVITDANSKITTSSITTTELGYLTDVTSNIQSQINGKAPTPHASAQTTYGVASATNYGHSKATATTPKMAGTAAVGTETGTFARGDHVHPTDTSRAAASHSHGNITNGGKLSGTAKVVVTDDNGNITTSEITSEELDYLAGVGDYVQDQLTANEESIDKIRDGISVSDGILNINIW